MKQSSFKIGALSAFTIEVLVKKTWLHTPEDSDHSDYRILIRPLKTAQFTWIFVGSGSHAYKILLGFFRIFLRFDLADRKDILRDCNCFI